MADNMADDEMAANGRREFSGIPRSSKPPRRGLNRRDDIVQRADPNTAPKKSSQSSGLSPETGNTIERESRRAKGNAINFHRRDTSSTSQESFDTSTPDTSLSVSKVSPNKRSIPRASEDRHFDFPSPESLSQRSKTATIDAPTDIHAAESLSHIYKGPSSKGSSSRQLLRRTSSLRVPTDSKMADQVDNKSGRAGLASKQSSNQPADTQHEPQGLGSREDSYVKIDETLTQPTDGQESEEDQPLQKTNGSTETGLRESGDGQAPGGVSYASALKSGLRSDDDHKNQDDDDSYPELDDMGMEEIHRPPTRRRTNGGIRWAPWNVPFKRRGQTLVVLMHSLSIVATVSLFFAFCANPFAWPLLLLYLLHVLSSKAATDGSLKYRSEWFRKSYIWHFFADYFPARLHKTHDLPATRKYIFGYHPHGIISHGAWAAFATDALGFSEKFPGITNSLLTLDSNFRIPFYREYVLGMGVRSVSKESIVNILNKGGLNGEGMGRGVTVVVGGARESLEAQPGMMRLILKERKGFIKLAVRCGADLVPVLAFGENDLYDQLQPREHPFMHRIQMFLLKVWKFTLPFLHGRGIFNYDVGLMPYRAPLNIVVGAPIIVRQSSSVNQEEINRLHGLYVAELEKLWDRYKDEFAPYRKEEMQILP
ncbi:DAGAT-domain-containing protein [Xylariaceae sp. AK1471]|nr:DAGAT-domain-containing protein [Xylariaceae sp. AK1471]